jgi:hypothetical protein
MLVLLVGTKNPRLVYTDMCTDIDLLFAAVNVLRGCINLSTMSSEIGFQVSSNSPYGDENDGLQKISRYMSVVQCL